MAVPKRKTSPSRRNKRRSHDFIRPSHFHECSNCGELKLSHHVCPACGFYSKKEIIKQDEEIEDEE
tara:strand:- start:706 stop:903 length:198 start_codon:yes stop_codon:yes gene_type:complete